MTYPTSETHTNPVSPSFPICPLVLVFFLDSLPIDHRNSDFPLLTSCSTPLLCCICCTLFFCCSCCSCGGGGGRGEQGGEKGDRRPSAESPASSLKEEEEARGGRTSVEEEAEEAEKRKVKVYPRQAAIFTGVRLSNYWVSDNRNLYTA